MQSYFFLELRNNDYIKQPYNIFSILYILMFAKSYIDNIKYRCMSKILTNIYYIIERKIINIQILKITNIKSKY